jgi:hypothetical protein
MQPEPQNVVLLRFGENPRREERAQGRSNSENVRNELKKCTQPIYTRHTVHSRPDHIWTVRTTTGPSDHAADGCGRGTLTESKCDQTQAGTTCRRLQKRHRLDSTADDVRAVATD